MDFLRKFIFIAGLLYMASGAISADQPEMELIDSLIQNKKFDLADRKLDEMLRENPKDANALMYKGILLYYRESRVTGDGFGKNLESIYDSEPESAEQEGGPISVETARKIESYFLKSLEVDPSQVNVHQGLCFAYSKAGMTDELITHLEALKKVGDPAEMLGSMIEYASLIYRAHSPEDGIRVMEAIEKLFPGDETVMREKALMYMRAGHVSESLDLLHSIEKSPNLDKASLETILLAYSLAGEYSRIVKVAESMMKKEREGLVYKALEERLENNLVWSSTLGSYLSGRKEKKNDIDLFADTLRKSARKKTLERHIESTQYNVPAPMLALNHAWGVQEYPDKFETIFNYADFLTYYGHYEKAVSFYKRILDNRIRMNDQEKEDLYFHYAWALHKTGNALKAHQYWKPLVSSSDFYRKSAASYFIGRYYYEKKDFDTARRYFSLVLDQPGKSKYAGFCLNLYNEISR